MRPARKRGIRGGFPYQRRSRGRSGHAIRWLAYGQALVLVLPFAVGGANSALLSAVASVLYLGWAALAFAILPVDRALLRRMAPVAVPLVCLLLWTAAPLHPGIAPGLISAPAAPDLLGVAWCHAFALVALLLSSGVAGRLRGFARDVAAGLCVCAGLLIVGTLALRAFGGTVALADAVMVQRDHRFSGLIGNANAAGISFGMISLILAGVARDRWDSLHKWSRSRSPLVTPVVLVGAFVALVLVALTQSRAAFAATMIAHATFAILPSPGAHRPSILHRYRTPTLLALLGGGAAALLAATPILDRYIVSGTEGPNRFGVLLHYGERAMKAPLFGHGLGSFSTVNQHHLTSDTVLLVGDFGAAHNAILQLAIEAGWPAVALVAVALIGVGAQIVRAGDTVRAPLPCALLLAVAIAVTGSMVDIALNVPAIAALSAGLIGLVWGRALGEAAVRPDPAQRDAGLPAPWPTPAIRN